MIRIGFIGMGNMAQALARGWMESGALHADEIGAFAPHLEKLKENASKLGFIPFESLEDLVSSSEMIIMACKPYQIDDVLGEISPLLSGKALLSIALGWDHARYKIVLSDTVRIQFIMPNTPARVREGIFLFEETHSLTEAEESFAQKLFSSIEKVHVLPSRLMGIGGAISGCGPAFADMIMEAFADAGVKYGLPRALSYELVSQMLLGSAKLERDTGLHPGVLKDAVCSPGGSTIRGVAALEEHGLRAACLAAVDAVMTY